MIVDCNPEFGIEMALALPYAYWLHEQGELEKVITSKGMKPFYYFCDSVEEKYEHRSIDNLNNGVQNLPNNWIHHNAVAHFGKDYSELTEEEKTKANGWLDYSQWECPPYRQEYYDESINVPNNYIVISNRYNLEHGELPIGYFDIECLNEMFNYLRSIGLNVIYKRPRNTEFTRDPNELLDLHIHSNGLTDYDLVKKHPNVFLMDEVIRYNNLSYNVGQLKIFSRSRGFISMGGGSSIFCSCFGVPVVIYVNTSGDIRPGYFDENSYFRKLSNAPIYPTIDKKEDIKQRGFRDYNKLHQNIRRAFGG